MELDTGSAGRIQCQVPLSSSSQCDADYEIETAGQDEVYVLGALFVIRESVVIHLWQFAPC